MALRQPDNRMNANEKLKLLRERLRSFGSAVVAFSSGVDSTFLLHVAHEELGDSAVPTINAFNALEPFKAVLLAHVLMYDVVKRCKKELQRRRINV